MDFVLMYPIILKYSYKYIKVLIVPRSGYFVYLYSCCLLRRRSSMLCISSPLLRTESPLLRPVGFFLPSFLPKKLTTGRAESATRYDAGPNGSVHGTKGERALRVAQGRRQFWSSKVIYLDHWEFYNGQKHRPWSSKIAASQIVFLVPPAKKFLSKRRLLSFQIVAKKIPRQVMPRYICYYLCDISHLRRRYWLMQVYKPCSCVLRRK